MRIELSATEYKPASDRFPVFDVNLRDPHYNALPVAVLNSEGVEVGRCDHLPPIRCTMPVPCGHCWFCIQFTRSQESR